MIARTGPDAWGNSDVFLVAFNNREFYVPGPKNKNGYYLVTQEEARAWLYADARPEADQDEDDREALDALKEYHVFPLSAYIHSGVALYLGRGRTCQFDSGLVGLVLVRKDAGISEPEEAAESLVKTWNDYLSGNVYGFEVLDGEDHVDSCWGFYGDYDKEGGALVEARSIVNHVTNNGTTDRHGQALMFPETKGA